MRKLGTRGRLLLKSVHILVSVILVGGAACILVLRTVSLSDGEHMHGLDYACLLIEQTIIIPAATGALLTGFLESWLTNWGFIRYGWVIVKWIVLIAAILVGAVWLGPWASQMVQITEAQGAGALGNPAYLQTRFLHTVLFTIQTIALASLPFLSVIKPWMTSAAARRTAGRPAERRMDGERQIPSAGS